MGVKIKKPKSGHYFHYCYECRWFEYQGQIGAYKYGLCNAIDTEERDVYSPPCGLFERRMIWEYIKD